MDSKIAQAIRSKK